MGWTVVWWSPMCRLTLQCWHVCDRGRRVNTVFDVCWSKTQFLPLCLPPRDVTFGVIIGADVPQMGQIWDVLRAVKVSPVFCFCLFFTSILLCSKFIFKYISSTPIIHGLERRLIWIWIWIRGKEKLENLLKQKKLWLRRINNGSR